MVFPPAKSIPEQKLYNCQIAFRCRRGIFDIADHFLDKRHTKTTTTKWRFEQVGVVVEPDDSAALAEAIDVLLDDVTTRQQLGLRARERSRLFDLETNLGLNLSLWSELAAQVRQ